MYNILDEPFIRCFFADGTQKELGILDVFKNSKSIVRIGGDSEVQEVTLLRLLIAVLYRGAPAIEDASEWVETWENGLPLEEIFSYLESHRTRFELVESDSPFYQIVNAQYNDAKFMPDNKFLLLDYQPFKGGDIALYSTFSAQGSQTLGFAFAARKLVELQAFNTASRKKIIKGDPRQKKRTYAQPGWLANGSIVHLVGKNLEKTLLLNFVPYGELGVEYADDLPVWEREIQTAVPEGLHGDLDESRIPSGPADLFTHQSSRITLSHDGDNITGAVVGIGDRLFKYNMHTYETMMAWREITRETKEIALVPVKQMPDKDAWRAINGLLGHKASIKGQQLPPKVAEYAGQISQYLSSDFKDFVPAVVTTVFYGPQDAIIENQTVSVLDLSMDALKDDGQARHVLTRGLEIAERNIFFYNSLLANLLVSEGKERKPKKGTTSMEIVKSDIHEYVRQLGGEYSDWIAHVTNENADEKLRSWIEVVFSLTQKFGEEAVLNASKRAIAGRLEDSSDSNSHINAAKALNLFNGILRKEKEGLLNDK